jgi:hypothetical protein
MCVISSGVGIGAFYSEGGGGWPRAGGVAQFSDLGSKMSLQFC